MSQPVLGVNGGFTNMFELWFEGYAHVNNTHFFTNLARCAIRFSPIFREFLEIRRGRIRRITTAATIGFHPWQAPGAGILMMSQLSKWTPEMDACVAIGINNGLSASLIADELGVTRNAVLGRQFRLGLCNPSPRKPAIRRPNKGRPKGALGHHDSIRRLGIAARACGFTVAELEQLRKDFQEDGL